MLFSIQISVHNILLGMSIHFCKGASFTINELKNKAYQNIRSLCCIDARNLFETLIPKQL